MASQRLTIADRGTFKAAANECGNANDKRAGTVDGGLAIEPRNRQHRVLHEVGGDEGELGLSRVASMVLAARGP